MDNNERKTDTRGEGERINSQDSDRRIEGAEIKVKSPFFAWLDNFLYHYKWHTIVAAFLVVVIVICSFQMCNKTRYDVYIMYAGGAQISTTAEEGKTPDFAKLTAAMAQYTEDFDGDGNRSISFSSLYIPSSADLAQLEKSGYEIPYSLINEDTKTYEYQMGFGSEFYILLLSEELFLKECDVEEEKIPFNKIAQYTNPNEEDYEYASEYGIYLSSTSLYEKAGFSLLPPDTVICIRTPLLTAGKADVHYDRSDAMLRALLKEG